MDIKPWTEQANELLEKILDNKEVSKRAQEELDSNKEALANLMRENNSNEFVGKTGKANFVKFEREGLVKDNVVDTVDGVNKGRINKIDMKDLTKEINVCFLNVRGFMND